MLKIVTVNKNEKFLRQKSEIVTFEQLRTARVQSLIEEMLQHVSEDDGEAGLSAIQIGTPLQIFIFENHSQKNEKPEAIPVINPELKLLGNATEIETEGCVSIPKIFDKVERHKRVSLSYITPSGKKIKKTYSGFTARIIQHEYDHLQGVLFTDKIAKSSGKTHQETKTNRETE
ncbi:MAG TPA: peptide deformylase [bacterium]|nr:peptide deformylase [bacterium]